MKTIIREAKEINSLINAFAKKNPNINPKDLEQLFTADPTTVQNSRGVFAGKYKVYEDANWVVYIPHTYEASRKIGGDTSWCTASSDDRYFNMYTKDGPLYVNIRKSDGAKFQFHFQSRQFMDSNDNEIKSKNIGLSKGLIKFYNNINPLFLPYMKYDYVSNFYDGCAKVKLNSKWNFIDMKGNLVSPSQWFDDIFNFFNGYAIVKLNNKYNLINTRGKLLSPNQLFEDAGDFFDGCAIVKLNGKFNFIDMKGNLISPNQWFDDIYNFFNGYAMAKLNGKWYKIDTKGNIEVTVNEHTVTITKSDLSKIVMECVKKIINIS